MIRYLLITEKIISILLIIWGVLSFYSFYAVFNLLFGVGLFQHVSLFNFIKDYHLVFLLPIVSITGGIFLLFNKKAGWIISLIALLLNALIFLIPDKKGDSVFEDGPTFYFFATTLISLIMFYILILPPFRNKYSATKRTWRTVTLITLLVLLDKTLLYLLP